MKRQRQTDRERETDRQTDGDTGRETVSKSKKQRLREI